MLVRANEEGERVLVPASCLLLQQRLLTRKIMVRAPHNHAAESLWLESRERRYHTVSWVVAWRSGVHAAHNTRRGTRHKPCALCACQRRVTPPSSRIRRLLLLLLGRGGRERVSEHSDFLLALALAARFCSEST